METPVKSLLEKNPAPLRTVSPDESVLEAIRRMADYGVGALLVLSKTGRLQGLLAEGDCVQRAILKDRSPEKTPVRDVMTRRVITVTPDQTVEECLRLMDEHAVRHLPVVDEGRVVGMLSIRDLLAHLCALRDETLQRLERYIEETP